MKTTDHLVIIFEGNTFAIFSSSDKPIEKKMNEYTLKHLKKAVMECIHNLLFSFSNTKIQQIIETTKFILTFL